MSNPTWTKPCTSCGAEVSRWPGMGDVDCPRCGASYNAFGQRLRDDWAGNRSAWDDEVGDMEGYEAQQVAADSFAETFGSRFAACGYSITDGNADDPNYAYCGHAHAHAGAHGNWRM